MEINEKTFINKDCFEEFIYAIVRHRMLKMILTQSIQKPKTYRSLYERIK